MRAEFNSFLFHFNKRGEAVDLETAAVRENWLLPGDERMNSSQSAYCFNPRPKIQMVSIDEHELSSQVLKQAVRETLHSSLTCHRSEGRSFNSSMLGVDDSGPGRGITI